MYYIRVRKLNSANRNPEYDILLDSKEVERPAINAITQVIRARPDYNLQYGEQVLVTDTTPICTVEGLEQECNLCQFYARCEYSILYDMMQEGGGDLQYITQA